MQIQRITSEWLRQQDVAPEHVRDFQRKWPDGLELTEVNLLRVLEEWWLDPDWFASRILSGPAQEAYEKAKAPAQEAYEKGEARAEEARQKAIARAWKAHQKAAAPIREAEAKALLRALEAYQRGTGPPITASTLKAYRGTDAAFVAYLEAKRAAEEAYESATQPAWEAYHKATARALAAIIVGQRGSA